MQVHLMYKCRLCGESFDYSVRTGRDGEGLLMHYAKAGDAFMAHDCNDGHTGLADLVGSCEVSQ